MNTARRLGIAGVLASVLTLGACFGGSDDAAVATAPAAGSAQPVPDSAGVSTAAFIAFILALNPNDESSEPSAISDTFAVPPDETSEPQPLS